MISDDTLLEVSLRVDYPNKPRALTDVSFNIQRGEVLGLVGESGSGKSTIALALLNLLGWKGGVATGRILFCGRDLLSASEQEMRSIRGRQIGLVSTEPSCESKSGLANRHTAWRSMESSRQGQSLRTQCRRGSVSYTSRTS